MTTLALVRGGGQRWSLDALMAQLTEPGFVTRYRRAPSLRETGGHVCSGILALSSPRSAYVKRWRRHARRCPSCASVFRYYGLSLK